MSEKYDAARDTLPEELKSIFDQFVEEYKFAGTIHHGAPFVSYMVLSEMIQAGWRPVGKPIGRWAEDHND